MSKVEPERQKMKAIIATKYGSPDVMQLVDVEKPVPKKNEVLVQVEASTVSAPDLVVRKLGEKGWLRVPLRIMFGVRRPRKNYLGHEFAGVITAVGAKVTRFKVGERVFGTTAAAKTGAYAEYIKMPEDVQEGVMQRIPAKMSFEGAAALPVGAMAALHLLRQSKIQKKDRVLVHGASGSVGVYAVQIAKALGGRVTAVCSTTNVDLVRSLGAEKVIDYTKEDYSKLDPIFDVVFDAAGKLSSSDGKRLRKKGGRFVTVRTSTLEHPEYLRTVLRMYQEGKVKPVIDRQYALEKVVKAHRYVEKGHRKGAVVITIDH